MDMQREDFIKLCKLPELTFERETMMGKRTGRTRDGMGLFNCLRVLDDWFPHGAIVRVGETPFISRGANINNDIGFGRAELRLLSAKTLEEKALSVFEALSMAELMVKEQAK